MSETATRTIEEELREVEREIENMERELAEREQPIVWGETSAEELEAKERRRAILPRLLTAARIKRLELQQESYRRQLESLEAERDEAYQKLQKAIEMERKAKEDREAAHGAWAIKLSGAQSLEERIKRTERQLRELRGEGS